MAETDRDVDGGIRSRTLWDQVIAAIDQKQRHDAGRDGGIGAGPVLLGTRTPSGHSPGSQLAYRLLAGCADRVALRLEELEARRGAVPGESRS